MSVSPRRLQRRWALQALYATQFSKKEITPESLEEFLAVAQEADSPENIREQFCWQLMQGVFEYREVIDALIKEHALGWSFNRIAKIDLDILRLGLFEMLYLPEVPLRVSIEEAVELAKCFGDTKSYIFVNGILNTIAKQVQEGQFPVKKQL